MEQRLVAISFTLYPTQASVKVAKVRDLLAFLLFLGLLTLLGEDQFSSGDEQWLAGTERLTPILYLQFYPYVGHSIFVQLLSISNQRSDHYSLKSIPRNTSSSHINSE